MSDDAKAGKNKKESTGKTMFFLFIRFLVRIVTFEVYGHDAGLNTQGQFRLKSKIAIPQPLTHCQL